MNGFGATADGSIDRDMAQFAACVADILQPAAASAEQRFLSALDSALGVPTETIRSLAQADMYDAVVARQVGQGVFGYVVDTACSSEEDLGIDSVKLGEILAVLRERFGLESRLSDDIKDIRTIATIADLLVTRLGQSQGAPVIESMSY